MTASSFQSCLKASCSRARSFASVSASARSLRTPAVADVASFPLPPKSPCNRSSRQAWSAPY